MSREFLLLAEALAGEKNVSEDIVFDALEFALAGAVRKQPGNERFDVRVAIDRETGEYKAYRRWEIVSAEDYVDSYKQKIDEAVEEDLGIKMAVGEFYEEEIEAAEFGRISAQTAKQVILQRIRDAEREQILNDFLQRQESLVTGIVKRVEKNGVIVEIGKLDAIIPNEHLIPREKFRTGDRIRAFCREIRQHNNRSTVILSRTAKEFLVKLFEMEVPEIEDGLLEIKAVARDPGLRAKIAVKSGDPRIDPQGTCIGVKGSRVKAVTEELAGENIDVVLWSPEPAQFIINALSPAAVTRILIDEDAHAVDVVVAADQLAMAIGRGGQNVRLAAELTGWNLNILTIEEAEERYNAEDRALTKMFVDTLRIEENIAALLVQEGFDSLEGVAYVPMEEMLEIDGIDEPTAVILRTRARDAMLAQSVADEEKLNNADEKLKELCGEDRQMLLDLLNAEVATADDLAELSADELVEITGIDNETATEVIMQARTQLGWFE
ncbi:MAG: transcription termination/antitermination protein NusA [Neisseriaceae bacterium]|nr:transcription termination/antitermination protein NusA [Neisseriaceae bacterium]MBQ9725307.1 transcription termination/antitermination protein NusA [Neisseriaceae bacterium]